jgi:endonuclease G, mitochondrial
MPLAAPAEGDVNVVTEAATGYDPRFLPGNIVPPPEPADEDVRDDLQPTRDGDLARHLTHFSLAMSAARRFCRWVAWNVDGSGLWQLSRGDDFRLDEAYEPAQQVGDELYADNPLDRGHIARRADLLWSTREEAQRANEESFVFTNITPQLNDFNQSRSTACGASWRTRSTRTSTSTTCASASSAVRSSRTPTSCSGAC